MRKRFGNSQNNRCAYWNRFLYWIYIIFPGWLFKCWGSTSKIADRWFPQGLLPWWRSYQGVGLWRGRFLKEAGGVVSGWGKYIVSEQIFPIVCNMHGKFLFISSTYFPQHVCGVLTFFFWVYHSNVPQLT